MIAQALRRSVRRRPASSIAAAASVTAVGYAYHVERNAPALRDDSSPSPTTPTTTTIPRDRYDPDAIARHWESRPVSIARRLLGVAGELGPVAGEYLVEIQLRPRLRRGSSDAEDDATTTEAKRKKLELERSLSQKLRASLTRLGPTFVKIGQQLSIRPDLVSPVVLHELQRLCDAVPPFEDEIAMKVLAEELSPATGDDATGKSTSNAKEVRNAILDVFEEVPQLVASASLGQVYKATLRSTDDDDADSTTTNDSVPRTQKQHVAIKVQRPDMLETVSLDLFLLVSYGKVVDFLCSFLTNQIPYHETFLNGFANGAFMELNYVHEAENQTYFRNELHARFHNNNKPPDDQKHNKYSILPFLRSLRNNNGRNTERVIVPRVYEQFTSRRVLVSEWIDGTPLARAPKEQIRELIPIGVELFLCQLLDIGRFHADPHPGNLYVTTSRIDGITPALCLLDFGLVAHVSEDARNSMTRAIVNLLQGDYDTLIAHDAKHLGFLPHDTDVTELKPVLKTILKEGLVEAGSNLHDRKRNLMAISNELNEVFFRYPFSVPPFFALVTRGLGLLEGIALTGDPSFDIFQASYPYAKRRAIETFSVKDYGKIS
eukprot:CAMPEP_0172578692 /NCGR_PEP_ID=MMETSP1067-20121228/138866_1 /TAXON_ID=265564 ORGANISM="Thalassiosira punctigera, Strain Tpunct2005C2" /NCGR_SAMPLE_ID=MMETSP1067 /ASSEMBLY_ACC=CAM_ASM_000444 /LENGTH=602 /DNA_ID=CAMNT_0013371391 /DNA_START=9 /DNA_END=1813 /DNA_ORIENTATION=+